MSKNNQSLEEAQIRKPLCEKVLKQNYSISYSSPDLKLRAGASPLMTETSEMSIDRPEVMVIDDSKIETTFIGSDLDKKS